ncbi:MAG: hypothetical protein QM689_02710 [Oscillospiraceae bacterium]
MKHKKRFIIIISLSIIVILIGVFILKNISLDSNEKKAATEIYTKYAQDNFKGSYDMIVYYDFKNDRYVAEVNLESGEVDFLWIDENRRVVCVTPSVVPELDLESS